MKEKNTAMKKILRNTSGLSTVEYVIILILIAITAISAWRTFGQTVVQKINTGNSQVSGLGP